MWHIQTYSYTQVQSTPTQSLPTATIIPSTATTIPSATSTPTEQAKPRPSSRGEAPLAYDSKSNQVILFGGATGNPNSMSSMNGETWIYVVDQNTWVEVKSPSSPSPRDNVLLAYDSESDRVILFGGARPGFFGMRDTWSFDMVTKTWTKMKTMGPSWRGGASMVYDSKADRMIVFGGFDFQKEIAANDTWSYDYNTDTWNNLKPATSPPGRNFQSMVYDSKADRVIMWGGWGTTNSENDNRIWIYDYNTNSWEERRTETGPSRRSFHNMTYDPKADRTILFGGYTGWYPQTGQWHFDTNSSETWAYDYNTNTWALLEPDLNPGPLSLAGMVYVPNIECVVLFGGKIDLDKHTDKLWFYDFSTNKWKELAPTP